MYILTISLLVGFSIFLLAGRLLELGKNIEIQSKLLKKTEQVKNGFNLKGVTELLYYFAQSLGSFLEKKKYPTLEKLSMDIEASTKVLGKPYDTIAPYTFIGIQLLSGLGLSAFCSFIFSTINIVLLALFAGFGLFIPYYMVKEKVKAKHKAIFRQIPDVLDMLTLMIEAGLDFNAALSRITAAEKGVLIEEFKTVLGEIKLGKPRSEAYSNMAKKVNYTPLSSVISSINNALDTGGSMGKIFRTLSESFRVERAQLAEKMAGEAPMKLMFPLLFFIFPTIFIIIMGPIVLSFFVRGGLGF